MDIYRKLGDNESTIRLARYFVMNRNGYSQSLKSYYDLLKKMIPADSWDKYLANMIDEIFKKGKWIDYDAEKHLSHLYPEQLVTL